MPVDHESGGFRPKAWTQRLFDTRSLPELFIHEAMAFFIKF